jgi:hypothetical protein
MLPPPVELRPPELVLKAVSDGLRIGLQVFAVPGLKRMLAEQGAWWCAPRRMWVMRITSPEDVVRSIETAYAGQFLDLEDVPRLVKAAIEEPQPDFFTSLLDVQIFPLQGEHLQRGRFAVSTLYDGLCLAAMRSMSGHFHKHAAAWQVRASPNQIIRHLGQVAGIASEFIFVHEQPVVLEELSTSTGGHMPITVPAMAPERSACVSEKEGTGYFSTEQERVTGLSWDRQAVRDLCERKVRRDYQAVGVGHLLSQTGACLGDDMGLGKSRQVVVALRMMSGDAPADRLPGLAAHQLGARDPHGLPRGACRHRG